MPYEVTVHVADAVAGQIDPPPVVELVERALRAEGVDDAEVGLSFAGDELLCRLNREHRGLDEPTDVLSFPAGDGEPLPPAEGGEEPPYLGDIAISVEAARRQAAEAGLTLDDELRHLALHGLLHLLGHDHETAEDDAAMREREEAVLGPGIHEGRGHGDPD